MTGTLRDKALECIFRVRFGKTEYFQHGTRLKNPWTIIRNRGKND